MRYLTLDAPSLLAGSGSTLRPVARRIAHAFRRPPAEVVAGAGSVATDRLGIGRVHSAGSWSDAEVHCEIAAALDAPLRPALRHSLEWYLCRGAHFHTDAHYSDVLFGVWYILGPAVDIVFARAGQRVAADPGALVIFDPFEVHGVLRRDATQYRNEDYAECLPSVFVGFEIELRDEVTSRFDMTANPTVARVVSSATRVSAVTGAFE
jgi:hypothetical protein